MRSVLAGTLAAAALGGPGAAQACSCAPSSAAEQLARADVAFVGEAIRTVRAEGQTGTAFRVREVLKGRLGRTVVVLHLTSGAACGVQFTPAARRVVLARRTEPGVLSTGLCSAIGHPEAAYRAAAGRR
jgi:hypothetical protein